MQYLSKLLSGLVFPLMVTNTIGIVHGRDLTDVIPSLYGGDGIALTANAGPARANAFRPDSMGRVSRFATMIASGFSFPLPTTQAGFTYEFDPVTNEFVKKPRSGGPLFAHRAETIGDNKFYFGAAFTYLQPVKFEGEELDDFDVTLKPNAGAPQGDRVFVNLDIEVQSAIFTLYGSYGITDTFEIGYVLPFFRNSVSVKSKATFIPDATVPGPVPALAESAVDSASESKVGIGDFHLRAKWHWWDSQYLQLATALEVRFPTGKEANLMGGRGVGMKPTMIASSEIPVGNGKLTPHLNVGYKFKSGKDRLVLAAGLEYGGSINQHNFTVIFDVLSEHSMDSKDGINDNPVDASLGLKWNLSDSSLVYANVIVPINKDVGLRPDAIPTIGYEIAF